MRLPRLFHTSSFRLTALYAAVFSASAVVLFAAIYWISGVAMTRQLDAGVDSDLTELTAAYRAGGLTRMADLVADRVRAMPAGPSFYLVENAKGAAIAGNLPRMAPRLGFFDLDVPAVGRRGSAVKAVRAQGVRLARGAYLVVGADATQLVEMRQWILQAFAWSFALTLLFAFGGGAFLSSRVLRRVEVIGRTVREIMGGRLSRRIPLRGVDDEFDHLGASLNAMLDRIEDSIEIIRQISNDIAHDLRTPLTRLRQRLEAAERKAVSADELRIALRRSIADADAILETFAALLRIAQIESVARRDEFRPLDLSELLRTVVEVYQPMAEERQQTIAAAIDANLAIRGDRELLAQMFANLLQNALLHSPPGAAVALSAARRESDAIEIVLADNGPGIPAAERENVFRRFYRLERSRTTPGNGLGLSLVAAVASLHEIALRLMDHEPGLKVVLRLKAAPTSFPAEDRRISGERPPRHSHDAPAGGEFSSP